MALDRFYNEDEILSKQPAVGQVFDNQDRGALEANQNRVPLGNQDILGITFNDGTQTSVSVEKHYYAGSSLVSSQYNQQLDGIGTDTGGYTLKVNPEQDIRNAGFNQGTYTIVYNFLHNLPGAKIKEISGDRTEVKIEGLSQNSLSNMRALSIAQQRGNSFTENPNHYPPLMLNLGDNNLIQIVNAQYEGQIVGEMDAYLQYPIGDTEGTIFFPVNDRALEAGLDESGESPYQTFAEVKIDQYTLSDNNGMFGNQNTTPHFELTGKFDEFKIVQNQDTSLSWIRKYSLGDVVDSGSLPPDTGERIARAVELPGIWNNGQAGGGVVVPLGQPYNWSVKYTRLNPEIVSTDTAIIKLYNPLPDNITVNQNIGLSAQLMRSYVEKIILFRNLGVDQTPFFSDPNFNIDLGEGKGSSGEFETWNSLLDAGTTTQQKIIDKFFSGSLGNIKLNTDHSNFKNFINFSSAEERVENFYYKLQQIEAFDKRIGVLNSVSGSDALTNISSSTRRRNELIGTFDDFEYWLYYNHDSELYSYYSSSDFTINPYPKSSRNPDVLFHSTSSEGRNWRTSTLASASSYDAQNANKLSKVIPVNINDDELNRDYELFINMIGQHFDISWKYIKSITQINEREEHPQDGLANQLIQIVANSFGWELYNGYSDVGLWQYEFGLQQDGNPQQSGSLYSKPTKEIVQETWRRLLNNLPGIYKTKGTARSFKTLIASYGIPSAFLKIREYGGPRVKDDKNLYEHERYVYKLQLDGNTSSKQPWDTIGGNRPKTIEYIGKLPKGSHNIFRINQKDGGRLAVKWDYRPVTKDARFLVQGGSPSITISSSYFPYVQQRDVVIGLSSGSGGYRLDAAWVDDFGEVLAQPTASTTDDNWNYIWHSSGSTFLNNVEAPFAGTTTTSSIQELRYYKKELSSEVISGHAQNREAYYSDDNTTDLDIDTSFENVLYRIFPDSKYNTTSSFISSRHPNQKVTASDRGFILSASYTNSDSNRLSGEVDTQFVTIPSVGALNLNNRKVRIESSSLLGNLQFEKSNERSQYDQAPIDSNLLGTYFSTTDTVNFDIYASEGYFSTDDLIGDTDVRNIDGYDLLDFRARNYFQKYNRGTALNILIGMLARYDMSIFDTMKQIVPARADWHKGILIEPHALERNNFKRPDTVSYSQHTFENTGIRVMESASADYVTYTSSITRNPFAPSIYRYTDIMVGSGSNYVYVTQSNPYWEYSPTGSTVLDARLSLSALEPKYFYSTDFSASRGPSYSNSASFHFAEVQDDRLTGGLENLFYNGCKISSDSLTTISPDTPDNTPVVEISTVDSNVLVYNTPDQDGGLGVESPGDSKGIKVVDPQDLVSVQNIISVIDNPSNSETVSVANNIFTPVSFLPPTRNPKPPIVRPSPNNLGIGTRPSGQTYGVDVNAVNEAINRASGRRNFNTTATPGGIFNGNTSGATNVNSPLSNYLRNNRGG